jgi:hypothetical protein
MEIESENYDPSDDISDGDVVFILNRAFLPRQAWGKMGEMCEVLSLGA